MKMQQYGAGGGSAVYGLGLLGSLFYYLQHAHTLNYALWGIIKSILWPGFFVYKFLEFFKM